MMVDVRFEPELERVILGEHVCARVQHNNPQLFHRHLLPKVTENVSAETTGKEVLLRPRPISQNTRDLGPH